MARRVRLSSLISPWCHARGITTTALIASSTLPASELIKPVSLTQLAGLCKQPSEQRIYDSCRFLKEQLPLRLSVHLESLRSTPFKSSIAKKLLPGFLSSCEASRQQFTDETKHLQAAAAGDAHEFELAMIGLKSSIESHMLDLCCAWQRASESFWFWRDHAAVDDMNSMMDASHWYVLTLRVMVTQHLAASRLVIEKPGDNVRNLIYMKCPVARLLSIVGDNCRAFCIEKNSTSPPMQITGDEGLRVNVIDAYLEFVVSELLKNALQAVIRRYGAWDADEAEPVTVTIQPDYDTTFFTVVVRDSGGGIADTDKGRMLSYYNSSVTKTIFPHGYSRVHGSMFEGIGVGVPLARVYAHFMGGEIQWSSDVDTMSTTVTVRLPKQDFTF